MKIDRHIPAPEDLSGALHAGLVAAGQSLSDAEMPVFLLAARDERGILAGACKGEVTFRTIHISELWVDEAARGQGLGRRLLLAAEDVARDHDCDRLHLETRNPKARALYESIGYRLFGELPDYDGDLPFCYMVKTL